MSSDNSQDKKSSVFSSLKKHKGIFIYILIIWLIFFVAVIVFSYADYKLMTLANFGMFGDSFNVITSLFTGLAFAGVIVSVILQTKELEATREELSGQKEQLGLQQQEMKEQNFDNKFFQMLNMFEQISKNNKNNSWYSFKLIFFKIEELNDLQAGESLEILGNPALDQTFNQLFSRLNHKCTSLKSYCIYLYQILKYIDESSIDNKKRYTNILRAQISTNELIILLYNAVGVIPFSGDGYKELLEKYCFFEYLSVDNLDGLNLKYINEVLGKYDIKIAGKNTALKEKVENLKKVII